MDNFENTPAPIPSPEPAHRDLQATVESLQSALTALLVLVLVVSGTLSLSFWHQARSVRGELKAERAMTSEYEQATIPKVNELGRKLLDYERTHPDLGPIITKYGIRPVTAVGPGATAPALGAAPAAARPGKK